MKRFQNNVIDKKVAEAILHAERILQPDSEMMKEIQSKNDWKFNSGNGFTVYAELCLEVREPLPVFTYSPWNPWTAAIGYFDGKAMHINSRKLPSMDKKDIVANLVHEYAHYCGFKHGNNYKTKEKCLYSVPYWMSENVRRFL